MIRTAGLGLAFRFMAAVGIEQVYEYGLDFGGSIGRELVHDSTMLVFTVSIKRAHAHWLGRYVGISSDVSSQCRPPFIGKPSLS